MASAFRATLLHCLADPGEHDDPSAWQCVDDGILLVDDGKIVAAGPAEDIQAQLADDVEMQDLRGKIIVPGFVDCHVHFSQLDIIASFGEQLLDWLNRYAYPEEMRFADPEHARSVAHAFVDELLANGTTTALVFATVHGHSAEAIFEAAAAKGMRLIAGKVLMDSNCPEPLRDDPESGYAQTRDLIERWHGRGRLGYAITPRFALTSSEAQLAAAGRLAAEYPDVWLHTHLAENTEEVQAIATQFPWSSSYLDVYDRFGLVRDRSVFAHCLHLAEGERRCMSKNGAAAAFCPSSNLFLGSGLFDLRTIRDAGVRTGLGTDVGGGTSLSLLRTMSDAYKMLHLQDQALPPMRALYLATLGAAEALYLEDRIGNFEPGKEADFVVLDPAGASITQRRANVANDISERLFALLILGDDRNVHSTWLEGRRV
ncbi:MAG: guanine deaminase [Woeseiaceae bacterium]|nr:guanine deaminase [Woeseiaceae bacterium]